MLHKQNYFTYSPSFALRGSLSGSITISFPHTKHVEYMRHKKWLKKVNNILVGDNMSFTFSISVLAIYVYYTSLCLSLSLLRHRASTLHSIQIYEWNYDGKWQLLAHRKSNLHISYLPDVLFVCYCLAKKTGTIRELQMGSAIARCILTTHLPCSNVFASAHRICTQSSKFNNKTILRDIFADRFSTWGEHPQHIHSSMTREWIVSDIACHLWLSVGVVNELAIFLQIYSEMFDEIYVNTDLSVVPLMYLVACPYAQAGPPENSNEI